MTAVILDGKGAGMTVADYEKMRALDCEVAIRLGWQVDYDRLLWKLPAIDAQYLRDEELGVPFYSSEMDAAIVVLKTVCTWRYAAQQLFFAQLQQRASYTGGKDGMPPWPDALVSLIPNLATNICESFVAAWQEMDFWTFDPLKESDKVKAWREKNVATFTEHSCDENGQPLPDKLGVTLSGAKPPWVH